MHFMILLFRLRLKNINCLIKVSKFLEISSLTAPTTITTALAALNLLLRYLRCSKSTEIAELNLADELQAFQCQMDGWQSSNSLIN